VRINVRVGGLREARNNLHAMRERAHDLTPAWEEVLTWWAVTNVEHFASRGRRWRTPWPALRPTTIRQKLTAGFDSAPLVRTTRLRTGMTGRPMEHEHMTHNSLNAGTGAKYAIYHQTGAPRAHIPARPLVNLRAVAAEGVVGSCVLTWIVDGRPNIGGHNTRLER
jgi:phage gpG-like protein